VKNEENLNMDLEYLIHGIDCHMVLEHICPPREGLYVLEPGCGSGKLGLWYAIRGAEVVLLDIDKDALEYAEALAVMASKRTGLDILKHTTFTTGSIHNLPYPDNTFDLVFNEGISQHWGRNPHDWRRQKSINEMVRVVKPNSPVCVIASNALNPIIMRQALEISHDYKGMPAKQKPYTSAELVQRLRQAGVAPESIRVIPVGTSDWELTPLIAGWGNKGYAYK